jgi:hypothetical protein
MKKRAIELQFNWIFVLIAGAVILAFFFNVVQKQRSLSEQKLAITLAAQMDAIYAGALESKGTTQPLATPTPGIAFSCSKVCECNFYIGKKATEFRDKLVFAPALIKDQDAIAWAAEWKLPFRVANFLFLTSPAIKYYLIYEASNPQSRQVYQRMLRNIPKEVVQETLSSPGMVGAIMPQGYAAARLVFLGIEPANQETLDLREEFSHERVSGISIDTDLKSVIFYEKSDENLLQFNSYTVPLALALPDLGDASLAGAFVAEDHVMYGCMMKRAFDKLKLVAEISAKRAASLNQDLQQRQRIECVYVMQNLNAIATAAQAVADAPALSAQDARVAEAFTTILNTQGDLQRQNSNLILQSCPELY